MFEENFLNQVTDGISGVWDLVGDAEEAVGLERPETALQELLHMATENMPKLGEMQFTDGLGNGEEFLDAMQQIDDYLMEGDNPEATARWGTDTFYDADDAPGVTIDAEDGEAYYDPNDWQKDPWETRDIWSKWSVENIDAQRFDSAGRGSNVLSDFNFGEGRSYRGAYGEAYDFDRAGWEERPNYFRRPGVGARRFWSQRLEPSARKVMQAWGPIAVEKLVAYMKGRIRGHAKRIAAQEPMGTKPSIIPLMDVVQKKRKGQTPAAAQEYFNFKKFKMGGIINLV